MATVNAYVTYNGNCEEAFNFYKNIFGGEFSYVGRFKDMPSDNPIPDSEAQKIMHISLPLSKETVLMGSDASPAFGPPHKEGTNFSLSLNTNSEAEAKELFSKLSEGGQVIMPLEKTFWGALFGMLTDKFGISWMVSYDYES